MKNYNRFALAATFAVTVFLGACSSTPVTQTAAPKATMPAPQSQAVPAATTAPVVAASVPLAPYLDPNSALNRERSVYFDFDQATVKPENARLMELHGKYLAAHPNLAIRIEGNTDEQGGVEYNLALGQKRAEAVRKALEIFGAKASQMEAVSFGEEKPKDPGHDEAAHAKNRRADLVYPNK